MALGDKLPVAMEREKAVPGGLATLGADGVLAESQRPSLGQIKGGSNQDLLINSYWDAKAAIINQRGETEYIGNHYGIDGWKVGNKGARITIEDNCLRLDTVVAGYGRGIKQAYENPSELYGKTITLSFLVKNINSAEGLYAAIFLDPNRLGTSVAAAESNTVHSGNCELLTCTATIPTAESVGANKEITAYIGYKNNGEALTANTADLIAAKLELGPVQTLAHKEGDTWVLNDPPPNKALELAKCQRYFCSNVNNTSYLLNSDKYGSALRCNLVFPVPMRATPTVTIISSTGKTPGKITNGNTGDDYADFTVSASSVNNCCVKLLMINGTLPSNLFGTFIYTADANL